MAKINDYPNKTFSQLVANADSFICTNGTSEYNITIEELFNYHLNVTDHDLSSFVTDAEAHSIAQGEAQTISDNGITAYNTSHLSTKEHHTTIEINGLAATAASSAISQHLIDANHPSFIEDLSNVTISYANDGDVLIYSQGYGWINGNVPTPSINVLDLADVSTHIGGADVGQVLVFDGSYWNTDNLDISQLKNMTTGTPSIGDTIKYNGSIWIYEQLSTGGASTLNDLTDVTVPGPESGPQNDGDVLTWNSGYNQWVPWPVSGSGTTSGWTGSFYIQSGQEVTVVDGLITDVSLAA